MRRGGHINLKALLHRYPPSAYKKKQEVGNCPFHDAGVQMVISCHLSHTKYQLLFWILLSDKWSHKDLEKGFKPFQPQDLDKNPLLLGKGRAKDFSLRGEEGKSLGPRLWHQHKTEVCSVRAEAGNLTSKT